MPADRSGRCRPKSSLSGFFHLLHSASWPLADNRKTIMTIIAPRVIMEDVATVWLPTLPAVELRGWLGCTMGPRSNWMQSAAPARTVRGRASQRQACAPHRQVLCLAYAGENKR